MTYDSDHDLPHPPQAAAKAAVLTGISLLRDDGLFAAPQGLALLAKAPHLICNRRFLIDRLRFVANAPLALVEQASQQAHFDVIELFAFVCPAQLAIPSLEGIAHALALDLQPTALETLIAIQTELLQRLAHRHFPYIRETAELAQFLAGANWPWAKPVLSALRVGCPTLEIAPFTTGLNVWDRLPEWEEDGLRPPGRQEAVQAAETSQLLTHSLGHFAEVRPAQKDYAAAVTYSFSPRDKPYENNILLAEAGTGLGKTMGYLVPAYLWARRNNAAVWISTYTKNLQRQLDRETTRLIDEPELRQHRVVVRKGRENYLCLLNLQEIIGQMRANSPRNALLAGLIVRWARFSRDGDMVGGDFPSWLFSLFSEEASSPSGGREPRQISSASLGITDRRGECIYAACPHFRKCFIERNIRAARKADLVIANHALVLSQLATEAALGPAQTTADDNSGGLKRLIFDEGHHLFDAADAAFSGHLTALEAAELRRWLRGAETERRRGRGLRERLQDLLTDDGGAESLVTRLLQAAQNLPGPGWSLRLHDDRPEGSAEIFLSLLKKQVLARTAPQANNTRETDCFPLIPDLLTASMTLQEDLIQLRAPLLALAKHLLQKLSSDAENLNSYARGRLEAMARSLQKRGALLLTGWIDMLDQLRTGGQELGKPRFIQWFALEQFQARVVDIGFHAHWVDPTQPFAEAVLKNADGILITSATLRDRPPDIPEDWAQAEHRTGVVHLPYPIKRVSYDSPFDYKNNSKVIIVTDVNRQDAEQVAAAYRSLFLASGGGALGLFTAISRLKAVHARIALQLAQQGVTLFAQHVDPMDTASLVDMFRADENACLLGTDAVRDGVDVPGRSLRLIVLDRVPWPAPTILERARQERFGGSRYTDMMVRLKLRQAFGRLVRTAGDSGVFISLDPRLASRFHTAFPPQVEIFRLGLVDCLDYVHNFTKASSSPTSPFYHHLKES